MIAERIKHARQAAGLTLDQVAASLASSGQTIAKATLSNYERGKSEPSASLLARLGHILNVPESYFLRDPQVQVEWIAFRKKSSLAKARQEQIKAELFDAVEGQYWLQSILTPYQKRESYPSLSVRSFADAEMAAGRLRQEWGLQDLPIDSLTRLVEHHDGIVVGYVDEQVEFDGLSGWANGSIPVIAVNITVAHDRLRYNIAHELGHMIMMFEMASEREQELFAHRFAAAFLVPSTAAYDELGRRRRQLDFRELALLKCKYGLSMQGWIRRAHDLEIIDSGHYRTLCHEFSRRGWRKREPVAFVSMETPVKFLQLTLRAWAEGIITTERAVQLCPDCVAELEIRVTAET